MAPVARSRACLRGLLAAVVAAAVLEVDAGQAGPARSAGGSAAGRAAAGGRLAVVDAAGAVLSSSRAGLSRRLMRSEPSGVAALAAHAALAGQSTNTSTPAPTPRPTPEPTEATPAPTPANASTPEPTPAPTPAPTPEPTPEPTEATPEPTPEVTPAPTPEPTQAPTPAPTADPEDDSGNASAPSPASKPTSPEPDDADNATLAANATNTTNATSASSEGESGARPGTEAGQGGGGPRPAPSPAPAPEGTDKTDCQWGEWTEWEKCTKTCGGGVRTKTRNVSVAASDGGQECVGSPKVTKPCNVLDCPVDCTWTEWEDWSKCSKECGFGEKLRTRSVSKEAAFGGSDCSGNATEVQACNSFDCPVDCQWGGWGGWTDCSRTCGGGKRWRERAVATEPAGSGKRCKGGTKQQQRCNVVECPVDCAWDDWGGWEKCSKPCGNGTANRKRTVKVAPAHDGKLCEGSDAEDKVCNAQPCPVECEWTDWSSWGACTATCGGATRARNRSRRVEAQFGGAPCTGADGETQPCETAPCPVDCSWQEWGPWQSCICGAGVKYRTREMDLESNGGQSCPDKDTGGMEKTACDPGEACVSAVKAVDYGNGSKPENSPEAAKRAAANGTSVGSSRAAPGNVTEPGTDKPAEGAKPDAATGTGPDVAKGTKPDAASGSKPDPAKGAKPDAANGSKPDPAKVAKPDAANGSKPDAANGTEADAANRTKGAQPDAANGTRPTAENGTKLNASNGTTTVTIVPRSVPGPLDAVNGTEPSTNSSVDKADIANGTKPGADDGTKADAANETKPGAVDNTKADAANGTKPGAVDNTKSDAANGTKSGADDNTKADAANGTKPGADDNTKSDAANGTKQEKWTVSIDKDVGQSLGIEYTVPENGKETGTDLPILKINGSGLLADWNKKNSDREVKEGDVIVEVNGKNSASDMADELGLIKKLDIVIFRPAPNGSSGASSSDTTASVSPRSAPTSSPSAAGGEDGRAASVVGSAVGSGSNASGISSDGNASSNGSGNGSQYSGQVVGIILLTVGQGRGATFAGKSAAATAMREAVAALAGVPPALVKANVTVLPNNSLAVQFVVEMSQLSGVSYADEDSFAQALAKKDLSSVQEEVNLALAKHDLEFAVQVQAIQAEARAIRPLQSGAATRLAGPVPLLLAAAVAAAALWAG